MVLLQAMVLPLGELVGLWRGQGGERGVRMCVRQLRTAGSPGTTRVAEESLEQSLGDWEQACIRAEQTGKTLDIATLMSWPQPSIIPVSGPSFCRFSPGMRSIHAHKCQEHGGVETGMMGTAAARMARV